MNKQFILKEHIHILYNFRDSKLAEYNFKINTLTI